MHVFCFILTRVSYIKGIGPGLGLKSVIRGSLQLSLDTKVASWELDNVQDAKKTIYGLVP